MMYFAYFTIPFEKQASRALEHGFRSLFNQIFANHTSAKTLRPDASRLLQWTVKQELELGWPLLPLDVILYSVINTLQSSHLTSLLATTFEDVLLQSSPELLTYFMEKLATILRSHFNSFVTGVESIESASFGINRAVICRCVRNSSRSTFIISCLSLIFVW